MKRNSNTNNNTNNNIRSGINSRERESREREV